MHKGLIALGLVALLVVPIVAGAAPVSGTYKTLFGTILPGKATESMPADLAEGQIGNMIWAESWNGAALGTNWKVMCPAVASAPVLVFDNVDVNGNGQRAWQTTYHGGTFVLASSGAWGVAGDPDYTGTVTSFGTTVYKQYSAGQIVGAVTNINLTGVFDHYTGCFDMAIANAELYGYTPVGLFPGATGPFPPFHGPVNCDVTGTHGTYWDAHDITLNIYGQCVVPNQPSSWGHVKSIYR